MSLPSVTVVICAYNYERWVAEAIDSALEQEYPAELLDVLVIDDGSTDGTPEVLERYGSRIRVVLQPNAGLGAARNTGARAARGQFLMFVDSDDTVELDAVQTYVRSLQRTGSDFAVASYQRLSSAGTWPGERPQHSAWMR